MSFNLNTSCFSKKRIENENDSTYDMSDLKSEVSFPFDSTNMKERPSMIPQQSDIKTILRIRPCPNDSVSGNYKIKDNKILEVTLDNNNTRNFTFSLALGENTTQEELFNQICIESLDSFLSENKNGLIFTYGMTCSGKTFTIIGSNNDPGVLPRSIEYILKSNYLNNNYFLTCNFFEIYNEDCYDLLANFKLNDNSEKKNKKNKQQQREKLQMKENNKQIFFPSINQPEIKNISDFNNILAFGLKQKSHAPTLLNENSSRSHTIFKIILNNKYFPNSPTYFSIVDLAGSERAKRTEATGINLLEATKINQSLSVLGKCLEAMRNNSNYRKKVLIPFRESKLTQVFQEYFFHNHTITMITNINPRKEDCDESVRALNFSCICKEIVTTRSLIVKPNIPRKSMVGTEITEIKEVNELNESIVKIEKGNGKEPQLSNYELLKLKEENLKIREELFQIKSNLNKINTRARTIEPSCRRVFNFDKEGLIKSNEELDEEDNLEEYAMKSTDIRTLIGELKKGSNIIMINPVIDSICIGGKNNNKQKQVTILEKK